MLIDEIILAGRKLKSFISRISPDILMVIKPNAIRTNDSFKEAIGSMSEINLDAFIIILRYYSTLSIDYRSKLIDSLSNTIEIPNVSQPELIVYDELTDTKKLIFELIYTITILDGSIEN